jgi:hypothetical protein
MTDQEKDKLWNEHCIKGNEHNPTDTMYYEGFMEAIDQTIKSKLEAVEKEIKEKRLLSGYANPILEIINKHK